MASQVAIRDEADQLMVLIYDSCGPKSLAADDADDFSHTAVDGCKRYRIPDMHDITNFLQFFPQFASRVEFPKILWGKATRLQ